MIPRHVWASSARCLCVEEKTRPASQALCAGRNRFSAPGMHFTWSAAAAAAASHPHREHVERGSRTRSHTQHWRQTADGNAVNRRIKMSLYFVGKLRLQEAVPLLRAVVSDWLERDLKDWECNQSYQRRAGALPVSWMCRGERGQLSHFYIFLHNSSNWNTQVIFWYNKHIYVHNY